MLKTCIAERKNESRQQNCTAAEPDLSIFLYEKEKAEKAATLAWNSHIHARRWSIEYPNSLKLIMKVVGVERVCGCVYSQKDSVQPEHSDVVLKVTAC